jgi:hypothetical protein
MKCSAIPKVLVGSVERIRRSGVGFGRVDLRVLFIPSNPGYTGLTSARDRCDQCEPFVGFASGELLNVTTRPGEYRTTT